MAEVYSTETIQQVSLLMEQECWWHATLWAICVAEFAFYCSVSDVGVLATWVREDQVNWCNQLIPDRKEGSALFSNKFLAHSAGPTTSSKKPDLSRSSILQMPLRNSQARSPSRDRCSDRADLISDRPRSLFSLVAFICSSFHYTTTTKSTQCSKLMYASGRMGVERGRAIGYWKKDRPIS